MSTHSPDFSSVHIHDARYGIYAGGPWVLLARLQNPRPACGAFGGDVPCRQSWERMREEGPVVGVTVGAERKDVDASDAYRTGADERRRELREFRERDR